MNKSIVITQEDYNIMLRVLDQASFVDPVQKSCLHRLLFELERATILSKANIPPDVVRLGSIVDVKTPFGLKDELILVAPEEANFNQKKISVISPLGSALLGYAEGDSVTWPLRNGDQLIAIIRVKNEELIINHSQSQINYSNQI